MQSHFMLLMASAAALLSLGLIMIVADLTSDGLALRLFDGIKAMLK